MKHGEGVGGECATVREKGRGRERERVSVLAQAILAQAIWLKIWLKPGSRWLKPAGR